MTNLLKIGFRYLNKFGIRKTTAALLKRGSKELSGNIDIGLEWYDFGIRDLELNQNVVSSWRETKTRRIATVNWFVPEFEDIYAGVRNIFRFADFLAGKGISNNVVICGDNPKTRVLIKETLTKDFPHLETATVLSNPELDSIPYADVSFATYWTTAYRLLKFNNTKGKYYFIQDYEPMFYDAGAWYGLVELTYKFGFQGITTAQSLKEIYNKDYGTEAEAILPCIDRRIFYTNMKSPREKVERVVFYARPRMSRNGFGLGMLALKKIKHAHPDIEIVTALGRLGRFDHVSNIRDVGLLTLEQTGELYRSTDVGLFLLFTPHPGVFPFELMASGCIVISNDSSWHQLALRNGYNCILCEPTVTRIADAFELIRGNYTLRCDLFRHGLEAAVETDWNEQMEKAYRFILG